MTFQHTYAGLKERSYPWLAGFLSLWLAVAYFWLAVFYPLMCAPYSFDPTYEPIDQTTAFEHTITPFSFVAHTPVFVSLHADFITSDASSNSAWLLDSHEDATGLAFAFIHVISLFVLTWLHFVRPTRLVVLLHPTLYKHLLVAPPEQPPRLAAW